MKMTPGGQEPSFLAPSLIFRHPVSQMARAHLVSHYLDSTHMITYMYVGNPRRQHHVSVCIVQYWRDSGILNELMSFSLQDT